MLECGCDEVGRGAGAAEVYAAACLLDIQRPISGLRDSKKLTSKRREQLAVVIMEQAVCYAIAKATVAEIEVLNIHHATLLAMKRAVEMLPMQPDVVYVDGLYIPELSLPAQAIVNGDDLVPVISAASILAKVARDNAMQDYHQLYPEYGFNQNKGYFTKIHREALRRYGPCPLHRKTYAPVKDLAQCSLF
jgi:ribonuclease HII